MNGISFVPVRPTHRVSAVGGAAFATGPFKVCSEPRMSVSFDVSYFLIDWGRWASVAATKRGQARGPLHGPQPFASAKWPLGFTCRTDVYVERGFGVEAII